MPWRREWKYNTTKLRYSEEATEEGVGGRGEERDLCWGVSVGGPEGEGVFTSCSGASCVFATRD